MSLDRVLVAGIGGASLGMELVKSLALAGRYTILGCDISPLAFGHFAPEVSESFVVSEDSYADEVFEICRNQNVAAVLPGGEGPTRLLGPARDALRAVGTFFAGNAESVIANCTDKLALMARLSAAGIPVPMTVDGSQLDALNEDAYPCVVKPSTDSGGSSFVFLATNGREAALLVEYLLSHGKQPMVQEYVNVTEGEFTVGVLASPSAELLGSIAMKRVYPSKLSIVVDSPAGLISSGFSQGRIDSFDDVRRQAEAITTVLESAGPMNIQGRVRNGVLLPFEVNPRFSASTHLRALAGFNEVDLLLRHVLHDEKFEHPEIEPGLFLRSFTEVKVPDDRHVQC